MSADQPLPLKFHAAIALEKVLRNEVAHQFVKSGLDVVIKCYLSLMSEFDNDELVDAFQVVMKLFKNDVKPYAVDIYKHMSESYMKCIKS